MKRRFTSIAIAVFLLALPALAANDCLTIKTLSANDVQTGEPVTISWSYDGGAPSSQTLTGHDFAAPVILAPDARSYSYVPSKPGEKHAQLAAVTDCGTVAKTTKYHVKQCPTTPPALTVTPTSVSPGATISASLDLGPGLTARWEVTNGTPSATTGSAIQVTAGGAGTVVIDAWVSRGSACAVKVSATVEVIEACAITEPESYPFPAQPMPNDYFDLFVPPREGETTRFEARGAEVLYSDEFAIAVRTPESGSFSIDIIVSNGTCTRTFTKTYEVKACEATATVSAGQTGSCGATSVVVDFTGVAPFQGHWQDGEYFFTMDSGIERQVQAAGTYTLSWFTDANCPGAIVGSVQAGSSLPAAHYALDEVVDGFWYGNDICPGQPRVARLTMPIPAGAEVVWTVENATILGGQGTDVLQFAGINPGPTKITVAFRDAAGCLSASYTNPYIRTQGAPVVSVSVEPSTIPAGGTAVVTMTQNEYIRGFNVTSSLGDSIIMTGFSGNTTTFEYRSSHGGGVATIDVTAMNACGETGSASTTLNIDGSNPVAATATVRALGSTCQDYTAYAEFTGSAPYSGTWSTGETFTTNDNYIYLDPPNGGTYTLTEFRDANGPGTVSGSATFDFTALPHPDFTVDGPANGCPNSVITLTLVTPLPDGGVATWDVFNATILSGQGTGSIQIQTGTDPVSIQVSTSAPGACSTGWAYKFLTLECGVRPTATLTTSPDPLCGANVTATFTGTAPFSGTWSDGQTFTTDGYTITRNFNSSQWVYVTNLADATRSDGLDSRWIFAEATFPPYITSDGPGEVCVGGTVTATAQGVPEGYGVTWVIEGTAGRIVSGQGTPEVVIEGLVPGEFLLGTKLRAPNGCEGAATGRFIVVNACP